MGIGQMDQVTKSGAICEAKTLADNAVHYIANAVTVEDLQIYNWSYNFSLTLSQLWIVLLPYSVLNYQEW